MRIRRLLSMVLLGLVLLLPVNASANSDIGLAASAIAKETTDQISSRSSIPATPPSVSDFSSEAEIIDFILNGPKDFASSASIGIEEILANSTDVKLLRNGNQSGTFRSQRLNTGTPGITWDYTVNYTIAPMPSGYGWYFVSTSVQVYSYIESSFYNWASSGQVRFTSASHNTSPSPRPTQVNVNMTIELTVYSHATAPYPVTYSENNSHTTYISNIHS